MPIPFLDAEILGSPFIDPTVLDELVVVSDDAHCRKILADAGITVPPENPPFTKSIVRFSWPTVTGDWHAMVFYEYGHPLPADNGFSAMLLPPHIDPISAQTTFFIIIALTEKPPQLAAA